MRTPELPLVCSIHFRRDGSLSRSHIWTTSGHVFVEWQKEEKEIWKCNPKKRFLEAKLEALPLAKRIKKADRILRVPTLKKELLEFPIVCSIFFRDDGRLRYAIIWTAHGFVVVNWTAEEEGQQYHTLGGHWEDKTQARPLVGRLEKVSRLLRIPPVKKIRPDKGLPGVSVALIDGQQPLIRS